MFNIGDKVERNDGYSVVAGVVTGFVNYGGMRIQLDGKKDMGFDPKYFVLVD